MLSFLRQNSCVKKTLGLLAYPLLCLTAFLTIYGSLHWQWKYASASFLFLIWTLFYLTCLERIIPYKEEWAPTHQEWIRDFIYFFVTMLGGGLALPCALFLSKNLYTLKVSLPLFFETLLTLLTSSLASYLFHRMSHIQKWIWLWHVTHHRDEKVNVGNNGVNHIFDVFFRRVLALLPGIIFGFSQEALLIVSIINITQGYFSHANIDVKLGFLNYFVVGPELHRLHHSRDLTEAGHYSVDISFWDLIFKTFIWRPGLVPKEVGVVFPERYPLPQNYMASLLLPFKISGSVELS